MGQAAVGAGDHDGVKGFVLGTVVQHQIEDAGGDLLFRDAGTDLLQNIVKGTLCDALGLDHARQLLRVLHRPEVPQQLRGRHQLTMELFGVAPVSGGGEVFVLIAHAGDVLLFNDLIDESRIGVYPVSLPYLGILHMAAGGLGIAAVSEIVIAVPGHQGDAIGAGRVKAGGVEAVGLAGQQHGVQPVGLQGCGDLFEMVHGGSSFPVRRCAGGGKASPCGW